MAPEFIEAEIDLPAMDYWALGCTIYQMLTGQQPFHASSRTNIINKIISNDLEWDPKIKISDNAKDIIHKLMQLEPELRLGAGPVGT